jgi:hypothetical protein
VKAAEELVLDGNALAGALAQIFVADSTGASVTCVACGRVRPLATARLYQGAGKVLRCAECDAILMRLVVAPGRTYLELTGIRCMELTSP